MRLLRFLLLCALVSPVARADYGWVPEYKKLITKAGLEFYSTDTNFDLNGGLQGLPSNAQLKDTILWVGAEYGIADRWSLGLEIPVLFSSLEGASLLAESSGFGDMLTRLKWSLKPVSPVLTLEAVLKFPAGKSSVATNTELVLGEGNFDFGLYLHTGHKGGSFLFSLSPGFLARFGGYSLAAALDAAVQFEFPRGYIRVFGSGIYSFSDELLFDSSLANHDAAGTGGSFSRLNGSPIGFNGGLKIGLYITPTVGFDLSFAKAIIGSRYPDFFRFGGNLVLTFDFFEAPKSIKAKEVPFNFDYEKY